MKIYSFYTRSHSVLKDVFVSSLQDGYEVEIECLDDLPTEKTKSGAVAHIGGGRNIWLYKTRKVIETIRANMGQVVVFADIDIKIFRKTEPAIAECLRDFNVLFQNDQFGGNVVNIGFMVIRCGENTARFFEEVLAMVEKQNIWDQKAVEMLLQHSIPRKNGSGFIAPGGLCWNHLPLEFLPWHMVSSHFTLSSFSRFRQIFTLNFRNVILCHGTEWGAMSNPMRKLQIYAMCERAMRHPVAWKAGYLARLLFVRCGEAWRSRMAWRRKG